MASIGPNAKIRVAGKSRHDLGELSWTTTREKTPFSQIGDDRVDRFTVGPAEFSFTGSVQSGPSGAFAIDWDTWCLENEEHPLVCEFAGRTERLMDVSVDSVESSKNREGVFTKSISGKFKNIAHE